MASNPPSIIAESIGSIRILTLNRPEKLNALTDTMWLQLRDHLDRINHYTTLAARQMHEGGRRAGPLDLLLHPPAAFLRNYVLRRGFLDGSVGLTVSLVNAYSVFLKFAKLWALERRRG